MNRDFANAVVKGDLSKIGMALIVIGVVMYAIGHFLGR